MRIIKTRKPVIPEAYTQVEWVKSDGTGEIDLGKPYPNNHASFKISMKYDVSTSAEPLFGDQHNSSNPLLVAYNGGFYCSGDTANDNRIKSSVFPQGIHTFECEMKNQTITYSRDNAAPTSYSVDPYSATAYGSTDTVLVLAYHVAAGNIRKGTATMYYLKLEFDGNVFCDLIPVKRNSDNAVGMYDIATNTFFSIPGTCGTPVADPLMEDVYYGDIKIPKYNNFPADTYDLVEYIQFNQNIYFDTGLYLSDKTSFDYDIKALFKQTETAGNQSRLFSDEGSGSTNDVYKTSNSVFSIRLNGTVLSQSIAFDETKPFEIVKKGTNLTVISGGELSFIKTDITFTAPSTQKNIIIGTRANNTGVDYRLKGKVYFAKFITNSVTLDLVPVKRKSDNEYGFYDLISGRFITKSGDGTATGGPVVDLNNHFMLKGGTPNGN